MTGEQADCVHCGEPVVRYGRFWVLPVEVGHRANGPCPTGGVHEVTEPLEDEEPTLDCIEFHVHDSLCYGIDNWRAEL